MKKKIIHLLCHSLPNDERRDYYIYGNWASRLAKNLNSVKHIYNHEVWYAIRGLNKKITIKKEGITYKLFPATTLHPLLESFYAIVTCGQLFQELQQEDQKNTIIHVQGERGSILHTLLRDFPGWKIVMQYHGYGQPPWLEWLERLFLTPLEAKHFPYISHFFVHIKERITYLKETLHIPEDRISYHNVGVDFNVFKPGNKDSAREKLGLPKEAFIMLYTGSMVKTKGVDTIIKAYQLLKKKYPQLYLLFIGANSSDPLYNEAIAAANKVIGLIDNKDIPLYYHAANVYCFYGDAKTTRYAGIGTAPTEALACNVPVISTNLIHLPDTIIDKAGLIPKNFNDFTSKIEYSIHHRKPRIDTHQLVAPYTSTHYMMKNVLTIYEKLFTE